MLIPPIAHLNNKRLMPSIQSLQLPPPSQRLRILRIALLTVHNHRPNRVQLPMLPQQMIPTEFLRRNIPNPHCSSSVRSCCAMRSFVISKQWFIQLPRTRVLLSITLLRLDTLLDQSSQDLFSSEGIASCSLGIDGHANRIVQLLG